MFSSFFPVERKPSTNLQRSESLSIPNDNKLKSQNERMKKQIDMLYHVLVDKETSIVKLKKFIYEELKKPEYEDNYEILEEQLNCILREEDYDPRHGDSDVHHDISLLDRNMIIQPSESEDMNINKQFDNKLLRINGEVKVNSKAEEAEKEDLDSSPTHSTDVNENLDRLSLSDKERSDRSEESTTVSVLSTSIDFKRRPRLTLTQKPKDLKRIPVNTIEQHTVTRRLFNFELELKEYSPATFDAIKLIISRKNPTAEEIHEEIEELAENASKSKYFNKIFPTDTAEKIADELENYIFELLHPKLFVICDDVRGRSQQFLDRLNVLKSFVTFEMLEIPVEMRKESLYVQPIREMRKMTEFKAPVWKIQSFQNAVNHILNAFSETVHRTPSSDELFPVLVYTVLQANIDLLSFNVDYIYTYIRKCHLMGQMGFLIINLKAVIQFLQGLNGNSLSQGKLEMKK